MTHRESILAAFRQNGNRMTLGYILQHSWGYEVRARFTELRREGYTITCTKGKTASENLYTLEDQRPDMKPVTFGYEKNGQGAFA